MILKVSAVKPNFDADVLKALEANRDNSKYKKKFFLKVREMGTYFVLISNRLFFLGFLWTERFAAGR